MDMPQALLQKVVSFCKEPVWGISWCGNPCRGDSTAGGNRIGTNAHARAYESSILFFPLMFVPLLILLLFLKGAHQSE